MKSIARFLAEARATLESRLLSFVLQRAGRDAFRQSRILQRLLKGYSQCDNGRARRLRPGLSYEQFREAAPLQNLRSLQPLLEQTKMGAPDVLWPGTPCFFVSVPDALIVEKQSLPVTADLVRHIQEAWHRAMLLLCSRGGSADVLRMPAIWPAGNPEKRPRVRPPGQVPVLELWELLEQALALEGHDPSVHSDLPTHDIPDAGILVLGAHQPNILPAILRLAQPHPPASKELHVVLLSPPMGINLELLRRDLDCKPVMHEVFLCEAGIIAAQDGEFGAGLRVFADQDLFLEFIPIKECDEDKSAESKARAIPLSAVKTDQDYVLVLSTPAGLCRYVTGELIRFVSTAPYRILRLGRLETCLKGLGEWLTERTLAEALTQICARQSWEISHFHVAPVLSSSLTGQLKGHHEWWVELRPGTRQTPTGPALGSMLDATLQVLSPDYAQRRKAGALAAPVARLLMPGLFDQWFEQNGLRPGQTRIPVSLPDRRIADALAKLARFYA